MSYVVRQVHDDYVDCVRWYGDALLTKSVDDWVRAGRPLRLRLQFRSYEPLCLHVPCLAPCSAAGVLGLRSSPPSAAAPRLTEASARRARVVGAMLTLHMA
jgi:hypothetical protein